MSIIDETIESVRSRGFLDNEPGILVKDAKVMFRFFLLLGQVGMIARALFRSDPGASNLYANGLNDKGRELINAIVDTKLRGEPEGGIFDDQVSYQMCKAIEEFGEFAQDFGYQKPGASTELADVFITVCSMAAAFGADNGYDLEAELVKKLRQDEERGHLHGATDEEGVCHQ